jgi:hypothetical protein
MNSRIGWMTLTLAAAFLAAGARAESATITAANCSLSSVQSAVNSARDGDTVHIPGGNCSWSSPVTIVNKAITLKGSGIFAIDANYNDVGTWPLTITLAGETGVSISGQTGQAIRVSGIHFTGSSPGYWGAGGDSGAITIRNSNRSNSWRIDNCKFSQSSSDSVSLHVKYGYGVFDHCYFNATVCQGAFGMVSRYGDSQVGAESIASAVGFGSANFVFFENCVFRRSCTGSNFTSVALDTQGGGRWVMRYCYLYDAFAGGHGSESGNPERGGYAYEVYNNVFYWHIAEDPYYTAFYLRGGTMLMHGNTFTNYGAMCKTWVRRVNEAMGDFGKCDGSRPWDGNTSPVGYPCLDQVGRGRASGSTLNTVQPQESYPARFWSNIRNNVAVPFDHVNPSYVVEGRDYFYSTDASARLPGYSPYTYPHPLTGAGNPTAVAPPQNLHIVEIVQ